MCNKCLQNEVDITKDIARSFVILQCRSCNRFLQNTKWVELHLESKELLSLCLKKIKKLQKKSLIDARFLWTEPHSKRIKVQMTIQGESFNNTIVQQTFLVEFTIDNQQCADCQKSFTENTWTSCVQIRQRVSHKRTFLYLEQIILKSGLIRNITGIKEVSEGLNIYFESRSHAQHLIEFLAATVPIRHSSSKRLISQDFKSNLTKYKYTIFAEIVPICREDLVCAMSKSVIKKLGGDSPLMLCVKVTNQLTMLNPATLKSVVVTAADFFSNKFEIVANSRSLVKFFVIDVVLSKGSSKKYREATVECVRSEDVNQPASYVEVETHLGNVLKPGDFCLGYDFRTQNIDPEIEKKFSSSNKVFPSVILVRKVFSRKKNRDWKLKKLARHKLERMAEQMEDESDEEETKQTRKRKLKNGSKRNSKTKNAEKSFENDMKDEERFLEELEECPEMRKNVTFWSQQDEEKHFEAMMEDVEID